MIEIKKIVFNDFQVNTYFIFDETGEALVVDPACYGDDDEQRFLNFVEENNLNPVKIVNTHPHIDHIVGNEFVKTIFSAKLVGHPAGVEFFNNATTMALALGFNMEKADKPDIYVEEGDTIDFGNSKLDVIYTPGHADGSISLIVKEKKAVVVGDLLFAGSIGRTDLPTGNQELLLESVRKKIFTLDKEYKVLSGHGPETTVGLEMETNPYF